MGTMTKSGHKAPSMIDGVRVRRDGWTAARQRIFLRALSETGCVRDACARARISDTSAYRMRKRSEAFARAWDRAIDKAMPTIEQAAYERAVLGWEEPVFQGGKVVGVRKRYSDSLLRLLLQRGVAPGGGTAAARPGDQKALVAEAWRAARAAGGYFSTPATQEETDRALARKLDAVERRLAREAEEQAQAQAIAASQSEDAEAPWDAEPDDAEQLDDDAEDGPACRLRIL